MLLAVSMAMMLLSNLSWGVEPAPVDKPAAKKPTTKPATKPATQPTSRPTSRPAGKNAKLPGLEIDFKERYVDIESFVCLDRGYLELIACTKGTKEHESIVAIKAKAMHIHVALLMLGAIPGNPAMQKPVNKEKTRWVYVPPSGGPVDVSLVFKNKAGKMLEHPISDFVIRSEDNPDEMMGIEKNGDKKGVKFTDTFLFGGSLLRGGGSGQRKYMSDLSGNVISIATFGDELLCLPGTHSHEKGSLMWQINSTGLPKVGSKVILRLRPKFKAPAKTGKKGKSRPVRASEKRT
jgi:hypothetical protein